MKEFLDYRSIRCADREKIVKSVYKVVVDCNIKGFPINCFSILQHYGFRTYSYEKLAAQIPELNDFCSSCSEDAFTWQDIVAYNGEVMPERIRFSLMHELGHYILQLPSVLGYNEQLADYFASNILAPRAIIYHMWYSEQCKTPRQIHDMFHISYSAAFKVYEDMQKGPVWEYSLLNKNIRDFVFSEQLKQDEKKQGNGRKKKDTKSK